LIMELPSTSVTEDGLGIITRFGVVGWLSLVVTGEVTAKH
jgi:hypothetical protein